MSAGPLSLVLAALTEGGDEGRPEDPDFSGSTLSARSARSVHPARSVEALAERTGLSRDVVSAALDHLVATGRLTAETLASGCPSGACGSCAIAGSRGGCPVAQPGRGRVISLTPRRPMPAPAPLGEDSALPRAA
ncbi:MAG: FeoC-like transcriptional regulator [Propionibacteriaceae bacterium]|jgi:hypothetical protein|nr:FeoC-like transcriptional regulator [Propionibacteriaceae bacterium]